MTATAQDTFQESKQEILKEFDFDLVVTAIRATNFGWANNHAHMPDEWFREQAIRIATKVLDTAFRVAQSDNCDMTVSSGGFEAKARPDGRLALALVLEDYETFYHDNEDNGFVQLTGDT